MKLFGWAKRTTGPSEAKVAPAAPEAGSAVVDRAARPDLTKRGVALLSEGKYLAAAQAFREALATLPESAAGHVNLAFALDQAGNLEDSIRHLQRAVDLDGNSFDAHYMLGLALERSSDFAAAGAALQRAMALDPDFQQAYADACRVLALAGDPVGARAAIEAGIARFPDNPAFHHYLGNLRMAAKDPSGALESYFRALRLQPEDVQAHINVGLALSGLKRYGEAIGSFLCAVEINPASADGHANLGRALNAEERFIEAATSLRRSLEIRPDDAEALIELGSVLQKQGELEAAIEIYARAIKLKPDFPGGYVNLGLALFEKGDVGTAISIYRAGLAIKPLASTHENLALALQAQGNPDEAIEHFKKALELYPDNLNTLCNLAGALIDGGDLRAGVAAYREILRLRPDHRIAYSNLLYNLSVDEHCSIDEYLDVARRFDLQLQGPLDEPLTSSEGTKRLRVGFVSADLRSHPVGYFIEGILRHIDTERFELFAYPTIAKQDELTERIKPRFSNWHLLKGVSDEAAARRIRADRIDVLLDLSGHTGDNRLGLFARRAAPVQITWLGYFASTGVAAMDYILADEVCVPPESECHFTEKVWRLPKTRLCFTPPPEGSLSEVGPLPAMVRGYVTFGCFQRLPKITDEVLSLWGRIFEESPEARLLLQSPQTGRPKYVDLVLARLGAVGIAADRVTVRGPALRSAYLQSYREVDVVLDTFPFTGGTTTCEALWMGVPTVTLNGNSMIARQGTALLGAAGLEEWVADTRDEYVRKAVSFAGDVEGLARLRSTMRDRVRTSALFDVQLFARHFGAALNAIWDDHLAARVGLDPVAVETI